MRDANWDSQVDTALDMCGKELTDIGWKEKEHEKKMDSLHGVLQFTKWVSIVLSILVIGMNWNQGNWLIAASIATITVPIFVLILYTQEWAELAIQWVSLMVDRNKMFQTSLDLNTERNLREMIYELDERIGD